MIKGLGACWSIKKWRQNWSERKPGNLSWVQIKHIRGWWTDENFRWIKQKLNSVNKKEAWNRKFDNQISLQRLKVLDLWPAGL